jgi:hypothetical protein
VAGRSSEVLIVGARPLNLAEIVCRRIVDECGSDGERAAPRGRSSDALIWVATTWFIANSSAIHRCLAS